MTDDKKTPKKLTVTSNQISESDKKIPRSLIIKYGDTPYILKAGLEWKANDLFGGAGYSLEMKLEPELSDLEGGTRYVFKAKLTVLANDATYINFGEASIKNTNKMMHSQLIHLASTRAECRVLRMATACGYASYEEVQTIGNDKPSNGVNVDGGDKPATEGQKKTIEALGGKAKKEMTKQEASDVINNLSTKK